MLAVHAQLAHRNDLYLASHMGCYNIAVESDCVDVIDAMQNNGITWERMLLLLRSVTRLASQFGRTTFQHCHQEVWLKQPLV